VELKPGTRLRSQVCETEVVVVKAAADGDLTIGGAPAIPKDAEPDAGLSLDPAQSEGTLLGKRYTDEAATVEILCVKAGAGSLALNGEALAVKAAKALPSSD
jgi:hypothetical protein